MINQRAASATDSVQAAAALQYTTPTSFISILFWYVKNKECTGFKLTLFRQAGSINPIETSASTGKHLARVRKQRDQILIPVSHLTTRVPERPIHGREVTKLLLLQGTDKLRSRHTVRATDLELSFELCVQFMVPADVITQLKNDRFAHFAFLKSIMKLKRRRNDGYNENSK
jgi:hypothetical protein